MHLVLFLHCVEAPHCLGSVLTANPKEKDVKTLRFVIKFYYYYFFISPEGKFRSRKPYCHHTTRLWGWMSHFFLISCSFSAEVWCRDKKNRKLFCMQKMHFEGCVKLNSFSFINPGFCFEIVQNCHGLIWHFYTNTSQCWFCFCTFALFWLLSGRLACGRSVFYHSTLLQWHMCATVT